MAWAKFPTQWIIAGKMLRHLQWGSHKGDAIAALLILIAMTIKRNRDGFRRQGTEPEPESDFVVVTYDELQSLIAISRSKVAKGLMLLMTLGIIERQDSNRSIYRLRGVAEDGGWAKMPQTSLIRDGAIVTFDHFNLRGQAELDCLKLLLLFVAFRNGRSGLANISYDKIEEYTGVPGRRIKRALSLLINLDLIYIESDQSMARQHGRPPNQYRILGL